jgi:iron complex transport system permease protein
VTVFAGKIEVRGSPARVARVALASFALLIAAVAGALVVGVEPMRVRVALADPRSIDAAILFGTRLTRVLLGAAVGAALAPAGVAFQALLRNPLADPYVLGVSGGAAVAGTLAIVLGAGVGWLGAWTLPVWAFGGAIASVAAVYALGRVRGRLVPSVALLAGVVWNALAAALIVAIRVIASPNKSHEALYWLTGSLNAVDGTRLGALTGYVLLGLAVLFGMAAPMNALALGDEAAHTVGVDTERARRVVFFAASLLTGAAVAFAGPIGFVGILVPHVLRDLLGPDHRVLLPASAFLGGAFLVAADTGARMAFLALGTEPTVGVITALLGAPFFLVVLRRRGTDRIF